MMSNAMADILFVSGLACIVAGGWMHGVASGLAMTGVAICVGSWVARYLDVKKRGRR